MILKETILSAFNERGTLLKWLKKVEKLITEKVLVKPVNTPQSTEIVAVNSTGEQVMIEVGAGLTIDNGALNLANVYDGTVIIEKAESVLGLRRFKDNPSFPEYTDPTVTQEPWYVKTIYNGTTYDILTVIYMNFTQTSSDDNLEFNAKMISFDSEDLSVTTEVYFDGYTKINGVIEGSGDGWITGKSKEFEVVEEPTNEIAKAWLLANTEGVSV